MVSLNIFIAGQKSFGAAVFKSLKAQGHRITGVACPNSGKRYDNLRKAAYCDPQRPVIVSDDRLLASDIPPDTDVLVAAHSHHFISAKARSRVRYALGYHPSLLPRHRGRDAVKWTIRFGDPVAGGTVYMLEDSVDGGAILRQEAVLVDRSWDHKTLWSQALFSLGIRLILETVSLIETDSLNPIPQDESLATWEPPIESKRIYRPELVMIC